VESAGTRTSPLDQRIEVERVSLALDAGQVGTWRWIVGTDCVEWDPALERIYGVEAGTFAGTYEAYLSLVHPDDRDLTAASAQDSLAQRGEHRVEHRIVHPDGSVHWVSGVGRVVLSEAGEPEAMVGVSMDITARKLAEQRLEFLARAGALLGSSLDLEVTLQQLSELAIEQLADWCAVDLVTPSGPKLVAVAHRDPDKVAYARDLRQRFGVDMDADQGLPKVLKTGEPEVFPELDEEYVRAALSEVPGFSPEDVEQFVALGLRSSLTVPLTSSGGKVLGALSAVSAESGRIYNDDDVALAMDIARRAGVAVENAQLYAQMEHASSTLQQSLLPPVNPQPEFFEVATFFAPAGTGGELIGGDFYDVFPLEGGAWCVVIGDVSGKGIDAAALAGAARWTFRSAMTRHADPEVALNELNEILIHEDWGGRFVTVLTALVTPGDYRTLDVRYASAGHPPPILRDFGGDAKVLPAKGQLVGLFPGPVSEAQSVVVKLGEAFVLYSDGFTETVSEGKQFGTGGLLRAVGGSPSCHAQDVANSIATAAEDFGEQRDDRALLVIAATQ
jgi:PAS domain S-box-containing protein